MRMSRLFSQTLRDVPGEAELPSHQLLLKAGLVRPLSAGSYSYLPLARRALTKIEDIIREEMDAIGGQEITMPVVHPASLWQETGRWYQVGPEMARFKDRAERDMVLGMTHEEVIADLVRQEVRSYRQLPCLLYQIQTKYRDEPRARGGLIRVREFTMKDSYSLDADWEGLDVQYRAHFQAYFNIFQRCHLPVIAVRSDVGMMGGQLAHEYMYLNPIGEDTLVLCDGCGYAANRQVAAARLPAAEVEPPLPSEPVATPDTPTIEALAELLQVPTSRTAKAVFFVATIAGAEGEEDRERFVFAVVRGDSELNETKLANAIGARDLRPAREEEIGAVGAEPGYASPVGLPQDDLLLVVDDAIPQSPNLVAGANRPGYHLRNTNYGRDYTAAQVTDLVMARDGDACAECGGVLRTSRGVEVGNIFKLGTRYTDALGAVFLDSEGNSRPVIMGSLRHRQRTAAVVRDRRAPRRKRHPLSDERGPLPRLMRGPAAAGAGSGRSRRKTVPGGLVGGRGNAAGRPRRHAGREIQRRRPDRPAAAPHPWSALAAPGRSRTEGARQRGQPYRAAGRRGADAAGRGGPAADGKPGAGYRSAVR